MRPTPVMMPVNMRAIVAAPRRPRRRRREGVTAGDAGEQAQVGADARRRRRMRSRARCVEPLERPERGQAAAAPSSLRREVDQQLVDQAFAQQRAVELVAGLDVQLVDAAPRQVGEHRGQVDLAGRRRAAARPRRRALRARAGARRRRSRRRRSTGPGGARMRAPGGVSRRESTTTRSGWRAVGTSRTSSRGSSSSTVPTPVSTAPARLRQAWPSARAASPVIHWLVPLSQRGAAVERDRGLHAHPGPAALHAREEADVELARLRRRRGPTSTSMPAARSRAKPWPATSGFGSRIAIDDPADAGRDQRVAARRRAAVVRAGLQRDVGGGAAHVVRRAPRRRAAP